MLRLLLETTKWQHELQRVFESWDFIVTSGHHSLRLSFSRPSCNIFEYPASSQFPPESHFSEVSRPPMQLHSSNTSPARHYSHSSQKRPFNFLQVCSYFPRAFHGSSNTFLHSFIPTTLRLTSNIPWFIFRDLFQQHFG